MSDELLHQAPTSPAPAEVVQPSTEAPQGVVDGTGASAPDQESEAQRAAERAAEERKVRAVRNNRAMIERLARERDEYRQIALEAARNNTRPAPAAAPAADADAPPSRDKFERWEDYEAALVEHQVDRKLKAHQERQAKEVTAAMERIQQEQYMQSLAQGHAARNAEFAKSVPDFEEVTARDDVVVPQAASEAIMSMPNSPAILYTIGRDPSLAYQMQGMSPTQQAAFVGQISASLMYRVPQVSKAPAPGTPVGGSKSAAPVSLETADYDTFVKLRRQQIAKRDR